MRDGFHRDAKECKACRNADKKRWLSALPSCSVDGCDRRSVSKKLGMCQPHKNRSTTQGAKPCRICKEQKPPHDFHLGQSQCKECRKARLANMPPCKQEGCSNLSNEMKSGLCLSHRRRQRTGRPMDQPIRSIRTRDEMLHRDADGNKMCSRCRAWLPEIAFRTAPRNSDGLHSFCGRCQADSSHNMSVEKRNELLEQQNWMCSGPGCRLMFEPHGGPARTWCVDHDKTHCPGPYSCGECIRGLLCNNCNKQARSIEHHLGWLEYCLTRGVIPSTQDEARQSQPISV